METPKRKASGASERPDKRRKEDDDTLVDSVEDGADAGTDAGSKAADIAKGIKAQLSAEDRSLPDTTIDELADILVSAPRYQAQPELDKILDLMTQARPSNFQAPNLTAIRDWWFNGYTIRWQHKATYMSQLIRNGAHCPLFAPSSRRLKEAPFEHQAELLQDAIRVAIAAKALGDTPANKLGGQTRLPLWDLSNDDRFSEYPSSYQRFFKHEGGPMAAEDPRDSAVAQALELARAEWEEYRQHTGLEYHHGHPSLKVVEAQFGADGVKVHNGPLRWSEMHSRFPDGGRDLAMDMRLDNQRFERLRKIGKMRNDVTAAVLPQYRSQVPDGAWNGRYEDDQDMGEVHDCEDSDSDSGDGEDLPPPCKGNHPGHCHGNHPQYCAPPHGQPGYDETHGYYDAVVNAYGRAPPNGNQSHPRPYDPRAPIQVRHQVPGHDQGGGGSVRNGPPGQMGRALDDLQDQNRYLVNEIHDLKDKNRALSDQNKALMKQNADLRFTVESNDGEVRDLVGEVKRLTKKCNSKPKASSSGASRKFIRAAVERMRGDIRAMLKQHGTRTYGMMARVMQMGMARANAPARLIDIPLSSGSDAGGSSGASSDSDSDRCPSSSSSPNRAAGSGKGDAGNGRDGSSSSDSSGSEDCSGRENEAPVRPKAKKVKIVKKAKNKKRASPRKSVN
ncbi:hypothetical protein GGTG_01129 [Gaeumannomyces tritici R3-111a-1]|uniref:Uncharacterized protein n=1 Tax=Gaeumannomyces tritici (strain R3-111a-1) TaxID=644352 RepID=J3NIP6_GAET3|nr:hypothetical protein GGTG_01129 [Gaeumannomyces tritici R3-111a-1]EJT81145.1 hypothetical protein GGTG_01129 [Gaeumannomyces tritici R3-111a-1]